uniref:SRCR domain-containing protein n=1 Tax=Salarias fasciatus TaxID=181472 RepID=A0A672HD74_SALFA
MLHRLLLSSSQFREHFSFRVCFCPPSHLAVFLFLSAASPVRLVNSGNRCSGRVEIFHAGQWGTVCDDHWDLDNANVVCRQLDCGTAQLALSSAAFGPGRGPIWLDEVYCYGNEPSISDCRHSEFGVHDCVHHEDASVVCAPGSHMRLANGGNSSCSGRVEIFHFGQWGTVCDDLWDLLDAEVVCRQLGCGRVLSAPTQARFGQGSGPIWYDDVTCTGSETKLSECQHQGIGSHDCGHSEDAGVVCEGNVVFITDSSVFLSFPVSCFASETLGTVCDDHWDLDNADVVCRQLDCGPAQSALSHAAFGPGSGPIWLDDVYCSGNEPSISDCKHLGFGVHNCGHHEDASVICEGVEGEVRLANGGNSSCSGRVEIFHFGQWGTVCDDLWDLLDAEVVCRQLGCGRVLSAPTQARFGQGSGPIWYDNVMCTGSETKLSECRHQGIGSHDCGHMEDAGVVCEAASPGEVRLANGGNSSCSGRVEIFHFGQWGTVCDDSWGLLDAEVVCRQLGCGRVLSAPTQARFGQGSGPIWYDNVMCTGNETKLSECRHQGSGSHDCGHNEDAGVVCEVRLVNSGKRCSGRVEIFHAGQWGTVCDDHWELNNADVVCRQLDCGRAQSALSNAAFGPGSGPIWLDDVYCSGNEPSISDCKHLGFGVHNCGHHEDASVITNIPTFSTATLPNPRPPLNTTTPPGNYTGVEGEVRLANGGNSSCSGRVEIFHFGQWGTVCDDSWGLLDAEVVCRQLGCGRVLSAPTQARFGQGSGPIWYDNVMCTGSETKLSECRHQGIGSHDCGHNEDAGVVCEAASPVRLVNSGNRCSGRVEIFHAGQWGTVCDDHWDLDNANVVCRQLDCGRAQSALSNAAFGAGRGPIWLDNVSCFGNDTNIPTVSTSTLPNPRPPLNITTPPGNYTGVEGEVRLANGGNSSCSGRVEIFHFGQWGTVCDDSWDLLDAEVVCRQLGCGRVLSAPTWARFGQGSGPIWYDDVMCTGSETKLSECRHQGIGSHDCGHMEDAGVVCEESSQHQHGHALDKEVDLSGTMMSCAQAVKQSCLNVGTKGLDLMTVATWRMLGLSAKVYTDRYCTVTHQSVFLATLSSGCLPFPVSCFTSETCQLWKPLLRQSGDLPCWTVGDSV